MKIAVVSSGHIPSQWAHSITTLKMANAFHRLGHDVEVLTVERFLEKKNKQEIEDIHKFYGINRGIKILYFKDNLLFYLKEVRPFNYILWLFKKLTNNRIRYISDPEKRISEYCRKNSVDICYCRSYRTTYYNIKNKVPTVMECHTSDVKHPDLQRVIRLSHSRYFKELVTIHDILKQNFTKAGVPDGKILVLDDGVDIDNFQNLPNKGKIREILRLPKNKKIVVYCGSLFPDKGIEHILLVAKNIPNIIFLVVGGPDYQRKIWQDYVVSYRIENVQFPGFVENNKVRFYLEAADALFMPYKTDQKIKIMDINTTSPLKLFEYMAAKRPIISTNIPAISRVIKHDVDGLLAEPNNIQQLTHFVETTLEDRHLAEKLSNNAYRKVQDYDWKRRCEKILKAINVG